MLSRVVSRVSRVANARMMSSGPYADLEGKVIVVGGAGNPPSEEHGIGAITSLTLASYGATVVSVSNVKENCDTVTKAIIDAGGKGMSFVADCTNYDDVQKLRDAVIAEYGNVDILVNAGIHDATPNGFKAYHKDNGLDRWKGNIDINLNAHFHLIHAFLPGFQEQGHGNILHYTTFGSHCALGMGVQRHGYFAGKGAAATLTRRVGIENAKAGIRANVISIGYAAGPLVTRAVMNAGADMDAVSANRAKNVPRGSQIVPQEVGNVCAFLASEASSGINATEVFCDGGNHGVTYGP